MMYTEAYSIEWDQLLVNLVWTIDEFDKKILLCILCNINSMTKLLKLQYK